MVELASIETPPELILFNAYLTAEKELERERQRVRQAEIAKDKAAARLKELTAAGAPRDEVAAAEQEYRDQVEALRRVKAGEPAEGEASPGSDASAGDAGTDDGGAVDHGEVDGSGGTEGSDGEPAADAGDGSDGEPAGEDVDAVAETTDGAPDDAAPQAAAEPGGDPGDAGDGGTAADTAATPEPDGEPDAGS